MNITITRAKSTTHFSKLVHNSNPKSNPHTSLNLHTSCSNPNTKPSPTYSSLLQLCIDSFSKRAGRSLHGHVLTAGYGLGLHLSTKFVIFYSKSGDTDAARRVFDEMPHRSVVSWTAMISGYSQNGFSEKALNLFYVMHKSGIGANQFTYGSVLRACSVMACVRSGKQIHGCVAKSRFVGDIIVQSALMDMHLKCGSFEDALCLFRRIERRDVISWNSLIGGCVLRGVVDNSFELFSSMLRDGLLPDHFTFGTILKACGKVKAHSYVEPIHALIVKLGYEDESIVTGSLIDAYAKGRNMHSARTLYYSLHKSDLVCSTALISGYSMEREHCHKAMELFSEINHRGMIVDEVILCSILNVCANVASLNLGRQIHAHTLKNKSSFDVAVANALIDMYSKSGELHDAHRAFNEMQYKNVISWTSLIAAYGKHGIGEDAITLFIKMENEGVKPNDVTFLSILSACSHSGLTNKGMEYFNSMVSEYKIKPRAEHYSCAVDILCRGGQLEEAYKFVCEMDAKPNTSLWGAMLGACKIYGNTALGEVAAGFLFSLDPGRSVNYIVLSNMYAAVGLWENAQRARNLMIQKFTKKEAGSSIIYLDKGAI
ncbi:pentatricopeptide repeat-containing protein At3g20730 [Ananas comosus]|uniref:Pentatricopeptide repeat-containing protein At3g20730 n=1 Tax=Ananas comosus TaxID=4615 RepID=A0A6P5GVX1_ANACO|nr:pentatricopeptide repeat-containing protein At3g20730 [Ananas comosus]XP_020109973.1 pentatricopeptide repeat-containing protein At3g20730 [Ananas comosus]XP_020109974.1 pentatricopeptide repeat-containing protein At3g20730 [Ananas comosus]